MAALTACGRSEKTPADPKVSVPKTNPVPNSGSRSPGLFPRALQPVASQPDAIPSQAHSLPPKNLSAALPSVENRAPVKPAEGQPASPNDVPSTLPAAPEPQPVFSSGSGTYSNVGSTGDAFNPSTVAPPVNVPLPVNESASKTLLDSGAAGSVRSFSSPSVANPNLNLPASANTNANSSALANVPAIPTSGTNQTTNSGGTAAVAPPTLPSASVRDPVPVATTTRVQPTMTVLSSPIVNAPANPDSLRLAKTALPVVLAPPPALNSGEEPPVALPRVFTPQLSNAEPITVAAAGPVQATGVAAPDVNIEYTGTSGKSEAPPEAPPLQLAQAPTQATGFMSPMPFLTAIIPYFVAKVVPLEDGDGDLVKVEISGHFTDCEGKPHSSDFHGSILRLSEPSRRIYFDVEIKEGNTVSFPAEIAPQSWNAAGGYLLDWTYSVLSKKDYAVRPGDFQRAYACPESEGKCFSEDESKGWTKAVSLKGPEEYCKRDLDVDFITVPDRPLDETIVNLYGDPSVLVVPDGQTVSPYRLMTDSVNLKRLNP